MNSKANPLKVMMMITIIFKNSVKASQLNVYNQLNVF